MKNNPWRIWLFVTAVLLAGGGLARASTTVNFHVDMSQQITLNNFVPGTDHVSARGSFNGWGELVLTNDPAGPAPSVYSGTANDTLNPNPGVETYKYYNSHNGQYDDGSLQNSTKNRAYILPSASGSTVTLPLVFFGDVGPQQTNQVTFRVNMAQQINLGNFVPGSSTVYARGTFNGWDQSLALTNDTSLRVTNGLIVTTNVYVGTATVVGGTNSCAQFKYMFDPGASWEDDSKYFVTNKVAGDNNRFFQLANQSLPITDFNDTPIQSIGTNTVTFQVDMSAQVFAGNFHPATGDTVEVRGGFNGWSGGATPLTNNPAASNTNLYSGVAIATDSLNAPVGYKFVYLNPGVNWESSSPKLTTRDSGPNDYNRIFILSNGVTVLPVVSFDDKYLSDFLPVDTLVSFTVNMNGAIGTDSHAFDPSVDTVWVNGEFIPWYAWSGGVNPVDAPPQYQLYETPVGSGIYSNSIVLHKGSPIAFNYKYGIGPDAAKGPSDDEAPAYQDRFRVVRSTVGGAYALPLDKFGNQYREPFFNPSARADGLLQVGPKSGNTVPVSWLGRPGAHLQSRTNLITGQWLDLTNTDGSLWNSGVMTTNGLRSVTNWPSSGSTYFRLIKQ